MSASVTCRVCQQEREAGSLVGCWCSPCENYRSALLRDRKTRDPALYPDPGICLACRTDHDPQERREGMQRPPGGSEEYLGGFADGHAAAGVTPEVVALVRAAADVAIGARIHLPSSKLALILKLDAALAPFAEVPS